MSRTTLKKRDLSTADATARLSIAEAAEHLGVSHWTIRRRIADGSLTAYRYGPRLIRVMAADVDSLGRIVPTVGTMDGGNGAS